MIFKMQWSWEELDNIQEGHISVSRTSRARVIGGWLVHHAFQHPKGQMTESMTFVPDRDHLWTIVPAPKEEGLQASKLAADFATPEGKKKA